MFIISKLLETKRIRLPNISAKKLKDNLTQKSAASVFLGFFVSTLHLEYEYAHAAGKYTSKTTLTFDEQLFVVVGVSDGMPRRRIGTAEMQPPGQRPSVIFAAAAKLVVVFQTLDGVAINLTLHDRSVLRMTNGIRTGNAAVRQTAADDGTVRTLHATDDYTKTVPRGCLNLFVAKKKKNTYIIHMNERQCPRDHSRQK